MKLEVFTVEAARKLVKEESFNTRGYILDAIKKGARDGMPGVQLPNLKLTPELEEELIEGGFVIDSENKAILWDEQIIGQFKEYQETKAMTEAITEEPVEVVAVEEEAKDLPEVDGKAPIQIVE